MDDRVWFKRYDEGVPHHIDYPEVPLFFYLEENAKKFPEAPCTIFKGAKVSYHEMNSITDRLAAGLAESGVGKGDRVGIFMPNTPQFVMAYFAILKLGAVVVAINPLYTAREIEHQVNDAGIEVMLVIAVDALAVNMTFALSHAHYLVVLMQCMRQTEYHRKHQAECQNQACNCFAHLSIHPLAKIRKCYNALSMFSD